MPDLIYAHCALRATTRPTVTERWPRMPGGSAPGALAVGSRLWVIVSTVPMAVYQESGLATRLSDVEWLASLRSLACQWSTTSTSLKRPSRTM